MKEIGKSLQVSDAGTKNKGRTDVLHVAPVQGKWSVRADASMKARKIFETKLMAVASAKKSLSTNIDIVVVHGNNGRVDYIINKDGRKL